MATITSARKDHFMENIGSRRGMYWLVGAVIFLALLVFFLLGLLIRSDVIQQERIPSLRTPPVVETPQKTPEAARSPQTLPAADPNQHRVPAVEKPNLGSEGHSSGVSM